MSATVKPQCIKKNDQVQRVDGGPQLFVQDAWLDRKLGIEMVTTYDPISEVYERVPASELRPLIFLSLIPRRPI